MPTARAASLPDSGSGVLITRPEPGASDTAARIAAMGFRPVLAPLLEIRSLPSALPPPGGLQAILVTSGNAIPALPATHCDVPLFAVGEATASRACKAGFRHVTSADGDAHALAALVEATPAARGGPLLLLTGKGQGLALANELRSHGFSVVCRAVYAAVPVEDLPAPASAALAAGELAAALFFSAETARQAVRLVNATRLAEAVRSVEALAIGQPAAVALQALPWRRIRVASRPNQDAILALLQ